MNNNLTAEEYNVIVNKGTEAPFTGKYNDFFEKGIYSCKNCGAHLYNSDSKFKSSCGWPSFDDEIEGAVRRVPDSDGRRTEIICANCGAHLGHVFEGEGYTDKNIRHCVNSISMNFEPLKKDIYRNAIFAGGCFWGMEYQFQQLDGVISVVSGYTGGHVKNPTYEEVCSGISGHIEAINVRYNSEKISYKELVKYFFEIHDPTQVNRQGPDIGEQYRSEIFYSTDEEKKICENLISQLWKKGYDVVTILTKATKFYPAEPYHQNYYERKGTTPYCHSYTKRF